MCLGVPGLVVEVHEWTAVVDFWGVRREVRLDIVDEPVAPGRLHPQSRRASPSGAFRRTTMQETLALYDSC